MLAAVGFLVGAAALRGGTLRGGLPPRMMATEASSRAAAAVELLEDVPKSRHVFCNRATPPVAIRQALPQALAPARVVLAGTARSSGVARLAGVWTPCDGRTVARLLPPRDTPADAPCPIPRP
jgi:hypothetical protein